MIKEIKKDENYQITPNFNISEFFSHSIGVESHPFDFSLIDISQAIRAKYGKTIVNSTFRTQLHNISVGGADFSRHLYGHAIDLKIERYDDLLTDLEIMGLNLPEFLGVITECVIYDNFIHLATSNNNQGSKPVINKLLKKKNFFTF